MPALPPDEYRKLDALAMAAGLRTGEFSSLELVDAAIAQAELHNPTLNAIISERFEEAREQARQLSPDQLSPRQPLAGLPFLIKDLNEFAGLPFGYGSGLYRDFRSTTDSAISASYRQAGLVVLGKTNTPEAGLTVTTEPVAGGATRNPWQRHYSPGGSSGGAAAAVAAGIVPVAHASDGGGSIRIPASCCGLFGLKPSRGLTVTDPGLGQSWSGMSVGHALTRSVRDSAAFLDLITLHAPGLFPLPARPASFLENVEKAPGPLTIAVQRQHPLGQPVHEDCVAAVERSAHLCETLGHRLEEIDAPLDYKPVVAAMNILIMVHTWQAVSRRLAQLHLTLEQAPVEVSTRQMAERGASISASDYIEARDTLAAAQRDMQHFHRRFDVLLSPVLSQPPARLGWLDMNDVDQRAYGKRYREYTGFTALFNGTGQPSMSVPSLHNSAGLPIGSQFSAAWGEDLRLLQLARQLEQAEPWQQLAG